MKTASEIFLILALSACGAVGTHFFHPSSPAWYLHEEPIKEGEVTLDQIKTQWNQDVLWIDARSREDYDKDHIPGAILINEAEVDALLFENFERLQSNTKPIIIYCSQASCEASHRMRDYLKERIAIEEIYVLQGGWDAWNKPKPAP